ncbi:MAG: hypothetical protein ACE37K_17380 [Planctomycetota bacterium]
MQNQTKTVALADRNAAGVMQHMFEARVHRVLVEDQDELVGLVSSPDLIGAIAGMV